MPSVWVVARKNKKGRVWLVRWESRAGGARVQGVQSCGPFKAYAEDFARKKREELAAGKLGVRRRRANATWREFADAYLDHCRKHKAPRTVRNFDSRALALAGERFGGRAPESIIGSDIAAWETDLLANFSPTTASMWLRSLRTALRWGRENGFIREVPPFHLPRVGPTGRALSDQEVQALLAGVSDRARPAVVFALHTGVRRGELLGLAWDRVRRTQEGHWEVEIGGVGGPTTKTGKSRVIPLHPLAVEAMDDRLFFRRMVATYYGKPDGQRKPRRTREEVVLAREEKRRVIAARREFNARKRAEREARRAEREAGRVP